MTKRQIVLKQKLMKRFRELQKSGKSIQTLFEIVSTLACASLSDKEADDLVLLVWKERPPQEP